LLMPGELGKLPHFNKEDGSPFREFVP